MKLYFSPGACSLSPHIALREAGVEVELIKVDLKTKTLEDGSDFTKINAKGYVPALQLDNGELLTEGPVIVQYIADRNPTAHLIPAFGTMARYRVLEWLNFISTELHKGFGPLFKPGISEETKAAAKEQIIKRFNWVGEQLGGRTYLIGDTFSIADGYLFTILYWTRWVDMDLKQWPELQAFFYRVADRPKVKEALAAEGLSA